MPLSSGQILRQRYRIDALLGEGGMGAVYRATDLTFNTPVAIKENRVALPESEAQFTREAALLHHLRHPNLPHVSDHFAIPGQGQYLVMDYVEGQDLRQILDQHGPVPQAQALGWISAVLDALAYLHSQDIIHRDVKPDNVKITPQGQVYLVDFGLAKVYDPHQATTGGARGMTPGFAPPEQYGQGRTDARSDIYSAAATLYALLTGEQPADALERTIGRAHLAPPRQIQPSISPGVESAVLKGLQPKPDHRFQTASAFRAALRAPEPTTAATGAGLAAASGASLARDREPARKVPTVPRDGGKGGARIWLWVLLGVLLALCFIAAGFGAALLLDLSDRPPPRTPTPTAVAGVWGTDTTGPPGTTTAAPPQPPTEPPPSLGESPTPQQTAPVPTDAPAKEPTDTSVPASTDTSAPADTPVPTATDTPTLTPSATPTLPCAVAVDGHFSGTWNRSALGCATSSAWVSWAAWQPFEQADMLWRMDSDRVIVLDPGSNRSQGTYKVWEDKWDGSDPEGIGLSPPSGLQEPVRGFGWLWRTKLGGPGGWTGWATDQEKGFCATIQPFELGYMLASNTMPSCEAQNFNWAANPSFTPLRLSFYGDSTWRRH